MKIIDIRKTQSQGLVIDVQFNLLPYSIPADEFMNGSGDLFVNMLIEYALTDPEHITIADPRTLDEIERDAMDQEWKETYNSLM